MTVTSTPPPPRPRRSWLLYGSLALNLLFVGLFAGAVVARHRFGPPDFAAPHKLLGDPGLRHFVSSLPKERRDAIRVGSQDDRRLLREARQKAHQARIDAENVIGTAPLDPARIETALANVMAADDEARKVGIKVMLASFAKMTPEERAQFQQWRRRHVPPLPPLPPQHDEAGEPKK